MIAQETDTAQPEDPAGTVGAYLALLGLGQELSCQPVVAGVSVRQSSDPRFAIVRDIVGDVLGE